MYAFKIQNEFELSFQHSGCVNKEILARILPYFTKPIHSLIDEARLYSLMGKSKKLLSNSHNSFCYLNLGKQSAG